MLAVIWSLFQQQRYAVIGFGFASNLLVLASPLFMLQVYDRVLPSHSVETLALLLAVTLACLFSIALLDVALARLFTAAANEYENRIGTDLARAMVGDGGASKAARGQASLRDVQTVSQFLSGPGVRALLDLPWFPIFLAVIFLMHPWLGAFAAGGAIVLGAMALLNDRMVRRRIALASAKSRRSAQLLDLVIANADAVRGLGMVDAVIGRWRKLASDAVSNQVETAMVGAGFSAAIKFVRYAIQTLMLALGAWIVITQHASPGIMIATTIILGRALAPIEQLVSAWRSLSEASLALARTVKVLRELPPCPPRTPLPAPSGALAVEGLCYVEPVSGRRLLWNTHFRIPAGTMLAIAGPSGSGKSTLARLLARVWVPTSGTVRLDSASLSDWDDGALGQYLGYLPQAVELLPGTIAQNICRFSDDTQGDVVNAAMLAGCHELILGMPNAYQTEIGDAGQHLSPGQRQRIALARAVYGEPRLVVLDEPNANLDAAGEQALVSCLQRLRQRGATVVIVVHKRSLMAITDAAIILRDGLIEKSGRTPDVLEAMGAGPAAGTPDPAGKRRLTAAAGLQT